MSAREKQFKSIQEKAEALAMAITELANEIEEGLDNTPENFQFTETADLNQSRLDDLREFESDLADIVEYGWNNP